jgi:hypothetical protein
LIAAAAALALTVAPAAQAKPPKTFYGVTPQTQLGGGDFERMGIGRVGTLRALMAWSQLDPTAAPLDFEWTLYDDLVERAAHHGMVVLPTIYSTPPWVAQLDNCQENCYTHAPRSTVTLVAWRSFLRAAVARYGPEGSFWASHPDVPYKPVTAWQIWNEQNSQQYFSPAPDPNVYAKLVIEASRAIKDEDPNAQVVNGGMFYSPGGRGDRSNYAPNFLRSLYGVSGFKAAVDGIAVHPYAPSLELVKFQVDPIRKEMKRAGDANKGLWVTEIGWASHGPKNDDLVVGKKRQAKLLRKAFKYFTKDRKKLHVQSVSWFSWKDTPKTVEPLCRWCGGSGLFSATGMKPKPAWDAFLSFTGGD